MRKPALAGLKTQDKQPMRHFSGLQKRAEHQRRLKSSDHTEVEGINMKYFALVLAGTLAVSLPVSALAERGGKGNGNAGGHTTVVIDDNGLSLECPPGLIKRDPACVPPGQANQGITTADTIDSIDIRIGERLSRDDFVYLEELGRWGLSPAAAGQRYAIVDGNIVLINNDSFELLQLVRRAVLVNN